MSKQKRVSLAYRFFVVGASSWLGVLAVAAILTILNRTVVRPPIKPVSAGILSFFTNLFTSGSNPSSTSELVGGLQYLSMGQDLSIGIIAACFLAGVFSIICFRVLTLEFKSQS